MPPQNLGWLPGCPQIQIGCLSLSLSVSAIVARYDRPVCCCCCCCINASIYSKVSTKFCSTKKPSTHHWLRTAVKVCYIVSSTIALFCESRIWITYLAKLFFLYTQKVFVPPYVYVGPNGQHAPPHFWSASAQSSRKTRPLPKSVFWNVYWCYSMMLVWTDIT